MLVRDHLNFFPCKQSLNFDLIWNHVSPFGMGDDWELVSTRFYLVLISYGIMID